MWAAILNFYSCTYTLLSAIGKSFITTFSLFFSLSSSCSFLIALVWENVCTIIVWLAGWLVFKLKASLYFDSRTSNESEQVSERERGRAAESGLLVKSKQSNQHLINFTRPLACLVTNQLLLLISFIRRIFAHFCA